MIRLSVPFPTRPPSGPDAAVPGLRSPAAGFDQPFEMLHACHERVQRTLGLLERLRTHLRAQGCDAQAREAARDVLRYFDIAAPLHHEDEELHVFPPLLAQGAAPVVELVRELQREHAAMAMLWPRARVPLAAVAGGEPGAAPLSREQERALDDFAALYAGHIDREEAVAYPEALGLLPEAALGGMGQEMARRRGG
ncbi:hemerythrin domain-containing protein [Paracidovorax cattleyae]|uniref:Hemerythrin HHE cation binding domain-containing protein n=1 Tax=Paracidovorax cattleyae TaxID=80868 RepID=A0A1H0QN18_9BURK|nr:hemerythrin domain-containing protein [Paracidovorax cattleyae]MBF9266278.1 hemerythrin domain-containing protein [Paracidovorax cattleyae]SDP18058.1 Hemerythrin HHE cation binding domain-containing protein [Paracidovorax cattleyae]